MRIRLVWKRYGHIQTTQNRSMGHVLLCQKKCLLSRRPCLDVKEVEVLSESDVLKNIQKEIITKF